MVHSNLLHRVLTEDVPNDPTGFAENLAREVQQSLLHEFSDIKMRNEAMLFCNLPIRGTARLGGTLSDIQVLMSLPLYNSCLFTTNSIQAPQLDFNQYKPGRNIVFGLGCRPFLGVR